MTDGYVVIQGWMCSELKLKGNDLLIYALIYGFSQDNESVFKGSRSYIADMFNISLPTVDKSLNNLINMGLIEKITETINNVSFNSYKSLRGSKDSLLPVKNLDTYNIYNNKTNNTLDTIKEKYNNKNNNSEDCGTTFQFGDEPKSKKPNLFSKCLDIINEWTNSIELQNLLTQYLKLCLEMSCIRGANQWKGMLNTLERVQAECNKPYADIIRQSINRGWKTFYPINDYSKPKQVENFKSPDTNTDGLNHTKATDENGNPLVF